eukprot:jgi/Tetstr1/461982/TSEL_007055.t1
MSPPQSKPWKNGDLEGFRMCNVIVIFFKPNCTSKVQPLDGGIIQAIKALFRKRHMSWILEQLNEAKAEGTQVLVRCSIRQAMECMLDKLSTSLASDPANHVEMADVVDILDMEIERQVFEPRVA